MFTVKFHLKNNFAIEFKATNSNIFYMFLIFNWIF